MSCRNTAQVSSIHFVNVLNGKVSRRKTLLKEAHKKSYFLCHEPVRDTAKMWEKVLWTNEGLYAKHHRLPQKKQQKKLITLKTAALQ